MRSLFLVCILGLALGAWADDGCVCQVSGGRSRRSAEWGYTMASTLVDSQTTRINALGNMVDELEAKLQKGSGHSGLSQMVHELEREVEKQETPLCDKDYYFSCGRTSGQCIPELLVCDRRKDCDSGFDEDADIVCKNPVVPGNKWGGIVRWSGCGSAASSDIEVMITGNKRYDWFPSRINVKATVSLTNGGVTKRYPAHGSYSFGMRRLTLEPDDSDLHVGVVCKDGGINLTECRFLSIGDLHECGSATLERV